MQTQAQIGAADDAGVIVGLEPSGAQVDTPRRQSRKATLEFGAPCAVARHKNHELGKSACTPDGLPAANPLLEPHHGLDRDVEVLVFGPAGRTDDEAHDGVADAEPREKRLAKPL